MKKKKVLSFVLSLLFSLSMIVSFSTVNAAGQYCDDQNDLLGVKCVGENTSLSPDDPRIIIVRIINVTLGLLGIVATVLIIYAGFRWMTAGGNTESIDSARKTLMAAVIGLVIILAAYSLSRFVLSRLYYATTGQPLGGVS